MRGHQSDRLARWAGLTMGATIVVAFVVAGRIPPGTGSIGAYVSVIAIPSGTLSVDHPGPLLVANDMRPGTTSRTGPTASLHITNITGHPLEVHLHALPSTTTLNDQLRMRVATHRGVLLRGTVGSLGRWSPQSISLEAGGSAEVEVAVWLPASATGYQGAIEDVSLEFHTHAPGA